MAGDLTQGMMERLGMLSDALGLAIDYLSDKFQTLVYEHWDNAVTMFNPGQLSIYEQEMYFPLTQWMDYAREAWPWVESSEYELELYSAYWLDVMERAFSDSIQNPLPDMDEIIYKAQELQNIKDYIDAIIF